MWGMAKVFIAENTQKKIMICQTGQDDKWKGHMLDFVDADQCCTFDASGPDFFQGT